MFSAGGFFAESAYQCNELNDVFIASPYSSPAGPCAAALGIFFRYSFVRADDEHGDYARFAGFAGREQLAKSTAGDLCCEF